MFRGVRQCCSIPQFVRDRSRVWDRLKLLQPSVLNSSSSSNVIVTLPDGSIKTLPSSSTAMDVARLISRGLAERAIVARVNGELYDMYRILPHKTNIEILDFSSAEARQVFWHSSSHILGAVLESKYFGFLCYGPPIEDGGFFYDVFMNGRKVLSSDMEEINQQVLKLSKLNLGFERLELSKQQLLDLFSYNPFKVAFINDNIADEELGSVYKCGTLIDLCRGPHIPHSGFIKSFEVTKNSSSYWKADSTQESLQRVYGISFPDKKLMREFKHRQELAEKRDHRKIGEAQKLFFFDRMSPGSCFFLPKGAIIYNRLINLLRDQYRKRGYQEVITPNVYNLDLWEKSGHLANYKKDMFIFRSEKQEFGMKPMNCPGHCILYKHSTKSYRDLPLRFADFGVLHRNELSGALSGLTRVRRFQQDDAHIFCTSEQISTEVTSALEFMKEVYGIFGFQFNLSLSTKPEKSMGDPGLWKLAEEQLRSVLDAFGEPWTVNPGDGAFYGPKIDVQVTDSLGRKHQCATVQLDFQMPIRFELEYKSGESAETFRPVMIHRAILGSVERFIALLTEHCGGKWPLWLSPRQVMVVPVSQSYLAYANIVNDNLHELGFDVEIDLSSLTLNKKIRQAQVAQFNYIIVVGAEEEKSGKVNVRSRSGDRLGPLSISQFSLMLNEEVDSRR